jgi:hypothetical protein
MPVLLSAPQGTVLDISNFSFKPHPDTRWRSNQLGTNQDSTGHAEMAL